MKERPILFSGAMVRAILEGRKTQTRRVVKGTALRMLEDGFTPGFVADPGNSAWCPYGKAGDRLWVRETFCLENSVDDNKPPHSDGRPIKTWNDEESSGWVQPHYAATDHLPDLECEHAKHEGEPCPYPWKPSIHMPRWASRITLEVTEVRVQRVQDISQEDAIAEGCQGTECYRNPRFIGYVTDSGQLPEEEFHNLWDSINAKRGFGWDVNPWVWAISFQRVSDVTNRSNEVETNVGAVPVQNILRR